ncbi:MAG: hypothetical protein CSA26_03460 [Desulfobacterales bacterium]|nr:MAG: hypothetical protein CSA26_03460 [Desulfobacterales bacterium]
MQCERLINLVKSWYMNVKDETMAPARMVQFIKQHVASCPVCQEDPDIENEIVKITEIVLPESKIPKAVRMKQEQEKAEYDAKLDEKENEDEPGEDDEDDHDLDSDEVGEKSFSDEEDEL